MKRLLLIPLLLSALAFAGCAQIQRAFDVATAPITNPVKPKNIYQLKLAFNLAVKGERTWKRYCWGTTYRALMVDPVGKYICVDRRETLRAMVDASDIVKDKINKADAFVKANPTVVPFDLINDAWAALSHYQDLLKPLVP